jgi:hypothetical protein
MARPVSHFWIASNAEHPAAVAGIRNARCDGVIRRLYVRERSKESGRLTWVGIGWTCDGCGEHAFDAEWQSRVQEGWRGRTDDEVFWARRQRNGVRLPPPRKEVGRAPLRLISSDRGPKL